MIVYQRLLEVLKRLFCEPTSGLPLVEVKRPALLSVGLFFSPAESGFSIAPRGTSSFLAGGRGRHTLQTIAISVDGQQLPTPIRRQTELVS